MRQKRGFVMKNCALFGHRRVYNYEIVAQKLQSVLTELIQQGVENFYVGNKGVFDGLALSVLRNLKKQYVFIKINLVFVGEEALRNRDWMEYKIANMKDVEFLSYPVEDVYFKKRITVSNQMMVDECDVVVCFYDVTSISHGVKNVWKYALKKNKKLINLFTDKQYIEWKKENSESFLKELEKMKSKKHA